MTSEPPTSPDGVMPEIVAALTDLLSVAEDLGILMSIDEALQGIITGLGESGHGR